LAEDVALEKAAEEANSLENIQQMVVKELSWKSA
jgi:hypothetical protein